MLRSDAKEADVQESATKVERTLGDLTVSGIGLGCWAIGGPFGDGERPWGWGAVEDDESTRAIRRGLELGVTFFDTADVYGTGHSEQVLGKALRADRERVAIATKFGYTFEEGTGRTVGNDVSPAYIRRACEASLRRLGTDWIDLYQLHVGDLAAGPAAEVADTLDELRRDGLIRAYGWSTDDVELALSWAGREHFVAVQHTVNVFDDAPELLDVCERHGLASVNRGPLAMGFLSGKFDASTRLPADDVRGSDAEWLTYFEDGRPNRELLDKLAAIREILTSGGRTPAQGALAWLWARSAQTIPIPGFKTAAQVEENARALELGPLTTDQMAEIETLLAR
jgi:aryl-alcohol dehydrogenase-like predicted oxidoreductase